MNDGQQRSSQKPTDAATLRKMAEEQARTMEPISMSAQAPEAIEQMLHELRVHQIELEMQNEELRRAQAEIEDGRARYFDLYDLAPVGYCTLSEKGLILEANLTAATLLGVARSALIKQPISRFIFKEDQDLFYLHRSQIFETGELQECDLRLVKPDGTFFWAHLTGTAALGENGAPVCHYVLSDITERKQGEQALKKSEDYLRSTLDGLFAHIAVLNESGEIILTNKAYRNYAEHNGIDPGAVSEGANYLAACDTASGAHSQEARPFAEGIREVLSGKRRCFELEYPCHPSDAKRWFVGRVTPVQGEGPRRVVVSHEDITERKLAENELRQSESLSRTLVNAIPDLIWLKDADGVYLSCNKRFERFFGASETEIRGKTDYDFVDEELADFFREHDRKALAVGGTSRNEEQITDADDGHRIFLETIKTPMFDSDGNLVGVLGIGRDITERKQAEEALKEASIRVSLATKAGGVGVWEYDLVHNRLQWDEQMYALYGISQDAFGGVYDYWRAGVHPEDVARCDQEVAMALRGEKEFGTEFRVVWPDGTVRHIQALAMVLRDADGKPLRMIGTNWDITERKRVEESLRESEERFKALHNASFGGIAIHDQGVILECNQGLSEISGFSIEELIGMDGLLLISEKTRDKVLKNIRDGYEKPYEAIGLRKNNDEYPVRLEGRNIPYRGKNVRVVEFRDITEAKQAEAEREKLQAQLQHAQKMEAIGTLAGGIAHDFNNILGAILGYAEMAQEDSPAGSMLRKDIDQIVKASHRATELVKQILAFSRQAETERIPLRPAPIIKEALKMLRSSLPSTIAIEQDIDQKAGPLLADPTQIHQTVVNLCTNAFHAMEKTGGTLSISLKSRELIRDDLALEPHVHPGRFVQLSIGDTGPGIAPGIREKIFDPYFTTKEVGKGTGMGLAIVHGIAKSYQGFVNCHSVFGEGTVFHVYLPVIAEPALLEIESAPLDPVQRGNERILFVDDDEILAEMGAVMLERLGYRVTVRRTSLEALSTFQNQPDQFDLVITDQTMPGMTGSDLARRILQIQPGMPIILCTGYSNLISEDTAKSLGIKGFAMKPLTKKEIAQLIREVLAG